MWRKRNKVGRSVTGRQQTTRKEQPTQNSKKEKVESPRRKETMGNVVMKGPREERKGGRVKVE